ncbi:MAG: DUF1223 domain-containing protein [Terriglobales bacterium]
MRLEIILAATLGILALAWTVGLRTVPGKTGRAAGRAPVLVELFTSEGCSSCPPADAFLQNLDGQPVAGAEMIVLSEHVDYWNYIGWNDPYSARFFSDRQSAYAKRFDLDGAYTPQMVVDGSTEFVGSDAGLARRAFEGALAAQKTPMRLSGISLGPGNLLKAHVETDAVPSDTEVLLAVALNHAESRVLHGENGGRTLNHTAVVRAMVKIGNAVQGQPFSRDAEVKLEPGLAAGNLRVIAFLQEAHQGKVLGAAVEKVPGS